MTVQLYPSLFTFTFGFIPMSIKRLVFDYKPVSSEKLAHVIGSVQGLFLKLFEQYDEKTLFLQTAFIYQNSYGKHNKRIKV